MYDSLLWAMHDAPTATDAPTLLFVALLFASVAAAASYWSARRAAKTDPMLAMRGD